MTDWILRRCAHANALFLAVTLVLLGACSSAPTVTDSPVDLPPSSEQPPEEALPEISLELPPSAFDVEFYRAEQALAQFDWMRAQALLDTLPVDQLTTTDRVYRGYLQARIDYIRGDQDTALAGIDALYDPLLPPAITWRLLTFRLHMLSLRGDHLQAAQVGTALLAMSPRALAADWKRRVWLELHRAGLDELRADRIATQDAQWLAWLDLALLARENTLAIGQPLRAWLDNNPDHLAANPLPGGLEYLLTTAGNPGRVALLLPLSGRLAPAGQAVLEGYLAAHYAARISGGAALDVLVLDTDAFDSASSAYLAAVNNQAQLVVGPLDKPDVVELTGLPQRPVPILALNRVEQDIPAAGAAMVQMALAPEDEARSVAGLAFGTGARNALVVRPSGAWGDEVETALRQRWEQLGGKIVAVADFTDRDDHSDSLKAALGLTDSEARADRIEWLFNAQVEATPRRRQDADVVFLLARNAAQARSIKPLLAFHYAGDLPVYGTSGVYSGITDSRDKDLNGITMVETPWLLGSQPGLRVAIAAGDTGSDSYTRLNALGADAFLLQTQFNRLGSGPDALLPGSTGLLTLDPQLKIQRELPAATFDKGVLQPQ